MLQGTRTDREVSDGARTVEFRVGDPISSVVTEREKIRDSSTVRRGVFTGLQGWEFSRGRRREEVRILGWRLRFRFRRLGGALGNESLGERKAPLLGGVKVECGLWFSNKAGV